jgi:phosphonate transport system substrate-binding protein
MNLTLAHWLGENATPICHDVARYLTARLVPPVSFVDQPNLSAIAAGRFALTWICGLLYTELHDRDAAPLQPVAAPVMSGDASPQYGAHLIVRRDAPYRKFEDLDGARLAINEPGSFSGHHILRHHLATLDRPLRFSSVVESGGHRHSVAMVAEDMVDTAAIDSTLYAFLAHAHPERVANVRILATLGPFPMPPWLVTTQLPAAARDDLRDALLHMHEDAEGRRALARHRIARFAPMTDGDYDPIRRAISAGVSLQ